MSSYFDVANPTQRWAYREAIVIDCTAGGGTIDATCLLPKDWDLFWNNVKAAGADIRVTDADGFTLLTYDLNGFNSSTRTLTIEIDNYVSPSATSMVVVWLYWGNSAATDASTVFAPAAAKTGTVNPSGPPKPIWKTAPERPGEVRAKQQMSKAAAEVVFVTFDFSDEMIKRVSPLADSYLLEEIDYFACTVELAGVNQTAMVDLPTQRLVHPYYVIGHIKGGTDAIDYRIKCRITTTDPAGRNRVLERVVWLKVRDVDEV
jgi:hypothetical protein